MNKDTIYDYLRGTATEKQLKEIKSWINESEANRKYLAEQKAIWTLSSLPDEKAGEKELKTIRQKLSLKEIKNSVYIRKSHIWYAAAAFIILIGLNVALLGTSSIFDREDDYLGLAAYDSDQISRIYTEKGTKASITLPDGSKVWMNSDSEIRYATNFTGKTRDVSLSGEAYFEVVTDSLRPMIVSTSKGFSIKVTGTKFHVRSYENDETSKTTLLSGKIRLIYASDDDSEERELELNPNETVLIGEVSVPEKILQNEIKTNNELAWKDGELIFDRTPMTDVIKMLERWYGATFEVSDTSVLGHRLSASFKTESLVQIMEVISMLTGIDYSIKDNTVVLGTDVQ